MLSLDATAKKVDAGISGSFSTLKVLVAIL
jgi:hypothetical protein